MTMKFEFDGWMRPYEYRAVGDMFYALAAGLDADRKERGFDADAPVPALATPDASQPEADEAVVPGIREAVAQDAATEAPKRERGKPAPGRARRTKEEIAEDEAADKADAEAEAARAAANKAHIEATEPVANISTGEERIDPTTPEDAAQDAADEAAEVEATKVPELSHDDVRAALTKYLNAFGTPAAMEDGPKVLALMFGAEVTKVSQVPADQASLAKAVAGIEEMTRKNPFARRVEL